MTILTSNEAIAQQVSELVLKGQIAEAHSVLREHQYNGVELSRFHTIFKLIGNITQSNNLLLKERFFA